MIYGQLLHAKDTLILTFEMRNTLLCLGNKLEDKSRAGGFS